MSEASGVQPRGIVLPLGVVQPLLLRFRRDDLHIMAFIDGHRDYEAVEAMIRYREDGSPSIRAILTRHDQRQIDHVNDKVLLAEARGGVSRETCHRDMSLAIETLADGRHARLEFLSSLSEPIVLDIVTADEPSPEHGGMLNPGTHSLTTSLPLALRRASTRAGSQTSVWIDGKRFGIPREKRSGSFVAEGGYYTEGHTFGVIRAGTKVYRVRACPVRMEAGEEWVFESDDGETRYGIASRDADGRLRIEGKGSTDESIEAFAKPDGLDVVRIMRGARATPNGALDIICQNGRFDLALDCERVMTGALEATRQAHGSSISLVPQDPDWAIARQVNVTCLQDDAAVTVVTSIGRS